MVGFCFSACSRVERGKVDCLNERSYYFHYKNLDSTLYYAEKAYHLSEHYSAGRAEALNNIAFVNIVKMEYEKASEILRTLTSLTDNQVELLIADIQMMRLCQRQSRNKEFYDYHESAQRRGRRIKEEKNYLSKHQKARLVYAHSEFHIVTSIYYYYVGLEIPSVKALKAVNPDGEIMTDTAQYLNLLYNLGAGGIIKGKSQEDINQQEFDILMRCYSMAHKFGYIPWEANSLQALSEKFLIEHDRNKLLADNQTAVKLLNEDNMPDTLLAGNMAQRALRLFEEYGDVYQTAGNYRTLASCYWQINDYRSAIICLEKALLHNKSIEKTPDLIASIREQLSVVYAAINDKQGSDFNRNIYLDLQEETRQDRYYESRAEQLEKTSRQLNMMIGAVTLVIVFIILLLWRFHYLRRKGRNANSLTDLLQPLKQWQIANEQELSKMEEEYEETQVAFAVAQAHLIANKKKNLEIRAKVTLVNIITPFIDRILWEVRLLQKRKETNELRNERYTYISELTDKINEYNDVLTEWIQLRKGELSLHIESFRLQEIFEIIAKSRTSFALKDIEFEVQSTKNIVKADRILTLFMLNTLADNARKFTDKGGRVTVSSREYQNYVEVSVADTGKGVAADELAHIFDNKVIADNQESKSHGFGLMNCQGIINKYRKSSKIFSVCEIYAKSKVGEGSTFSFRLPKGILRTFVFFLTGMLPTIIMGSTHSTLTSLNENINNSLRNLEMANTYADSAYYSNIKGNYHKTLAFADTCRYYLNKYYLQFHPTGKMLMKRMGNDAETPAEIKWFHDNLPTNFSIILDIRNESAVAALALHKWALYRYNNKVYTHLFKETSSDKKLGKYCRMMQRSESNKNVAVILLIVLLISIFPLYYFMYYRHQLFYLFCEDKLKEINKILVSNISITDKLTTIDRNINEKFPKELMSIINKIREALLTSATQTDKNKHNIEMAEDELRRLEYEDEQLHISNNILDNCLSTLKHETMYYPSRIRQLVDDKDTQLQTIGELAAYYKNLYSLLSLQAMRQITSQNYVKQKVKVSDIIPSKVEFVENPKSSTFVIGDMDLLKYLFEIIARQFKNNKINVNIEESGSVYVVLQVIVMEIKLSEADCIELFTPATNNIPFLICRQIVREIGEITNRRRCGITAQKISGNLILNITLSKAKV